MKKLFVLSLFFITATIFTSCKQLPIDASSTFESEIIFVENTSTKSESVLENSTPQESENTTSEPTSSVPEPEPVTPTAPNSDTQTPSNNSGGLTISGTGENKVRHPISGLPFKQVANPDTGISWDGVSPIIYTYPDGTTGTEKRVGATYEHVPGMIGTIHDVNWQYNKPIPEPNPGPHYCDYCGKEMGHGGPDTCLRYWTGGDHNCPNCGEVVPEDTCHTCS